MNNKRTLETEIIDILKACEDLEHKIKRLRTDIEAMLNVREEVSNDNDRREDG